MVNQNDLRVKKTKKNIRQSFFQLLQKKEFKDITVQNILDLALINRTTFYTHYNDKYDLAEQLSEEFLGECDYWLAQRFDKVEIKDLKELLGSMYDYMLKNQEFFQAIWYLSTEDIDVYKEFEKMTKKYSTKFLQQSYKDEIIIDYYSSVYASLVVVTITKFFQTKSDDERNILLNSVYHVFSTIFQ